MRSIPVALFSFVLALAASCARDPIEVIEPAESGGDFNRAKLLAAVAAVSDDPESPEAYRLFAREVSRLSGGFNERVGDTAELYLSFLALGPLDALFSRPLPEQAEALALTVWPTAFEVEPREGEDASAFLERICLAELATDCKHLVSDRWPLVLGLKAWETMRRRARSARSSCRECVGDESFARAMEVFDRRVSELGTLAGELHDEMRPSSWPEAGEQATPWSDPPLLVLGSDGRARLEEQRVEDWRAALVSAAPERGEEGVLGVYLRPTAEVRLLREVLGAATAAGFREVALQARERTFPFPAREYRLRLDARGGRRIAARDEDTVQTLTRRLDAALASGPGPYRL